MKFLLGFFFSVMGVLTFGQNMYPYGHFNTRNFDYTEQKGGFQNWDIIQNNDGYIYVANNEAVLEYNGSSWYKFEFENKEHPRSFAKNAEGTIFVGGQSEFGKIVYDSKGMAMIEKMSSEFDSLDFNDIWQIYCIEEKTYFISRSFIFIHDANGIEVIDSPNQKEIISSIRVDEEILCMTKIGEKSINHVLRGNKFYELKNSTSVAPQFNVPFNGKNYVIDQNGDYYVFKKRSNVYQLEKDPNLRLELDEDVKIKSITANEKMIVVGTKGYGVQLFRLDGKYIRSFSAAEGLGNLLTYKAMFDQYNNIWLCNDNGVLFIETSSAITSFGPDLGVSGGVTEDLSFDGDNILLATHSDLFISEVENRRLVFKSTPKFLTDLYQIKKFKFLDGTELSLVIGNEGIFSMDAEMNVEMAAQGVYAWDMFQSTSDRNRIYIALDGAGVGSMYYDNGKFTYEGDYPNTKGDVRSICEWNGDVYYTVKYDGVHYLDTSRAQEMNVLEGLIDYGDSSNYDQFTLALFNDNLFIGTSNGLYEVNNKKLEPSHINDDHFNEEKLLIHRIINDENGKLWIEMFHNSGSDNEQAEFGFLTLDAGELTWNSTAFNQVKEDVIFSVKKARNGIYWLGGEEVYAYNENTKFTYNQPFKTFINRVFLNEDEVFLYNTHYAEKKEYVIDYDNNTLKFDFSCNAYLGGIANEYSYYLEGEDQEWSKWKNKPEAVYQRLAEGDYVFHVKAKNFYGVESEETSFTFSIAPPWYRTWWAYLIYVCLFILLIYVAVRLSIRRVKAQNERLEEIVEERTAEIAEQNATLEHQKAEIEEKTNDILDSIKYAERIQTAILPPEDEMNQIFEGENFVLFKPKDIVSGDFYWAERFGQKAIFSAVDCTGHGVPGAFVSIVGFNGLNRTVNEFDLRMPGEILDKLTELVVETFSKSESQIKDGMDIALCTIDYETNKLYYAGANNPLIQIRNGELIEIKANKQPIGEFENRVPFTTHEIDIQKGDCFYVFSDGYADQFGGPKGKKFKGKTLKNLLLEMNDLPMNEQHIKLNEAFENWKGDFEQLDDVCLIGVRI
ncbi:MAG: SpoIIE family protein phosphatase [Crocinitomicaceae bacterium]